MNITSATATTLALFLLSGPALAESQWWEFWKPASSAQGAQEPIDRKSATEGREMKDDAAREPGAGRFSRQERQAIAEYFGDRHDDDEDSDSGDRKHKSGKKDKGKKAKGLPPGLQKKLARGGELPIGWQRKLARGEVMSAELYGASRPLPPELYRHLPRTPAGTEIRVIEDKVVRVLEATREIIDVLGL